MTATIGAYTVVREIGRGGTAIVYRATDPRTGHDIALKVPLANDAGEIDSLRLVLREVRMAARLVHPNIVRLLGAFEHDGRPCLAMEFVDGPTLGDLLRAHGPFPLGDIVHAGVTVAAALAFAHERGVLHQDVTPNNILVAPGGVPKLGDFGLGRFAAAPRGGAPPRRFTLAGTPAYLSPEQVLGLALDGRTDVFSLGAVLYELCTGQLAFGADDLDGVLEAVRTRDPAPIRSLRPDLPESLEALVMRALAKNRDERFDAAECAEALSNV